MTLRNLAEWLRCPNCLLPLSPVDTLVIGCDGGHRFDVNKRGHVSLLPPHTTVKGDSAVMLDARDRFFAGGWYSPIADAVGDAVQGSLATTDALRVVDVGCGTGYYLDAVKRRASPEAMLLATDLSPTAVTRAVRAVVGAKGVVLDVWKPLPLRDGCADVVLNVFAPRNPPEFARILAPGGSYLGVIPAANHLIELRDDGRAIGVADAKASELDAALSGQFDHVSTEHVEFTMDLGAPEIDSLIGMGPSAHHRTGENELSVLDMSVTASVDVVRYRRR